MSCKLPWTQFNGERYFLADFFSKPSKLEASSVSSDKKFHKLCILWKVLSYVSSGSIAHPVQWVWIWGHYCCYQVAAPGFSCGISWVRAHFLRWMKMNLTTWSPSSWKLWQFGSVSDTTRLYHVVWMLVLYDRERKFSLCFLHTLHDFINSCLLPFPPRT